MNIPDENENKILADSNTTSNINIDDTCSSPNASVKNKNKRKMNNTSSSKKEGSSSSNIPSDEAKRDQNCLNTTFPSELEIELLCAIFAIGLKESSPKVLLDLMPKDSGLSNEHIKSHLQKYRIHSDRSQQEFLQYWNDSMANTYHEWESQRGWEEQIQTTDRANTSVKSQRSGKQL